MERPGEDGIELVRGLMLAFAERTGLTGDREPARYLWTDAFAVCNFLELEVRTGDEEYRRLAVRLAEQVHRILGRHRPDDPRRGWISGLSESEGTEHPTIGGLRIGKPLPERPPGEPADERLEWDRDGQYFHYLTRWMHALARLGRMTGDPRWLRWGLELATTAYERFRRGRGLAWKMSIDLRRPLVDAMGQHDPVDGLVTFHELRAGALALGVSPPTGFDSAIEGLARMSQGARLASADPLGTGGLLTAACTVAELTASGAARLEALLAVLLDGALPGVKYQAINDDMLTLPPAHRLAFRELGLAIGLHGAQRASALLVDAPRAFDSYQALGARLDALLRHRGLAEAIEGFWRNPEHRQAPTWREHEDINAVMLATSLAPGSYLAV